MVKKSNFGKIFSPKFRIKKQHAMLILVFFLALLALVIGFTQIVRSDRSPVRELSEEFFTNSAQRIINDCQEERGWRACYGEQLARLNKSIHLADTLKVLDKIKLADKRARDCHLMAHWISLSQIEKNLGNWISVFDYVDQTTCNNGFVHGVLEGRSRADPAFEINQETIIDTCEVIDQRTSKRLGIKEGGSDDACGHVMGHVVLAEQEASIPKAVSICGGLPKNLKKSCFHGIFMENITRENLEAHEVAVKLDLTPEVVDELESLCGDYADDNVIGEACWRELAHVFTDLTDSEPLQSYEYCYLNDNIQFAQECYMHAINLMILSPNYSQQNLKDTCKNYWEDSKLLNTCISRTIGPLMGSTVEYIDRAADFCAFIPEGSKEFCYSKIGERLKSIVSLEKRISLCKAAPEQFRKLCLSQ